MQVYIFAMYRTSASEALLWNDRPEDILFKAQLVKQVTAGEYEKVANIPLTTKNFETIVQDINAIDYEFAKTRYWYQTLLSYRLFVIS